MSALVSRLLTEQVVWSWFILWIRLYKGSDYEPAGPTLELTGCITFGIIYLAITWKWIQECLDITVCQQIPCGAFCVSTITINNFNDHENKWSRSQILSLFCFYLFVCFLCYVFVCLFVCLLVGVYFVFVCLFVYRFSHHMVTHRLGQTRY